MNRYKITVMETIKDSRITEEMIFNSLDTFKDKPIIFNSCKNIKIVGHIESVEYINKYVLATVIFYDKNIKEINIKNWCVEIDKYNNRFEFLHVEIV